MKINEARALRAASGWLDLGNAAEAEAELRALPADIDDCPDLLLIRWEIHAKKREWEASLAQARALVASVPESIDPWVKQSFSLHELKRTQEAWDALSAVEAKFPDASIIPYNLACYACQLGRLDEARALFAKAMALAEKAGEKEHLKEMALDDPDLAPLRAEIEKNDPVRE